MARASDARTVRSAGSRRSALRSIGLFAFGLLLSGCESSTDPAAQPRVPAAVQIRGEDVLTVERDGTLVIEAVAVDSASRATLPPATGIAWSSADAGVARVSAGGRVTGGPGLGAVWIHASAAGLEPDSVLLWIQPPAVEVSTFRITLLFADDVPDGWRTAIRSAADRWEQVVRAALPPVELDTEGADCPTQPGEPPTPPLTGIETGVRVYVGQSRSFPPDTWVRAIGGPCLQRPLPHPTTIFGHIVLNRDHAFDEIATETVRYLAVHELGHVLGLVGLIQGFHPPWWDHATGQYTGLLALAGYRKETGERRDGLHVNGGSHWSPPGDIMSAHTSRERITFFTVGSLMDMGYPAAWYGAGPWQ